MKREFFIHFAFVVSFFIFISVFKGWLSFNYWLFWSGGVIGTLLPDLDHIIYVYFFKPHELTSQRVNSLVGKRSVKEAFRLLIDTRSERKDLIFHSVLFQVVFFVLAFLVLTSSGNIFGRGLVLAFLVHLFVDQMVDFFQLGSLGHWFKNTQIVIDQTEKRKSTLYLASSLFVILLFGFFL